MPRTVLTFRPGFAGRASAHRTLIRGVGLFALLAAALPARAAEVTRLVSAGDDNDPYDVNVSLAYRRSTRQARLVREGLSAAGQVVREKDQLFRQTRNIMDVRADVGVLPDLGLFLHLPLVLSDDRSLSFDGTNASTSSLLRDGIVPGFGQASYGLDANNESALVSPSDRTFVGPTRNGLEWLAFGFAWGMLNQSRVPSEPTWMLALEARVDVSKAMRFDPARPKANTSVGRGYHQLVASTMVSRRFGPLEPYLGGWYMFPIKTATSPFKPVGLGGNAFANPQHQSRLVAGVEATVWERPADQQAISLELQLHMENRFLGLARGELWEPLSGSSLCPGTTTACRPGLDDRDITGDGINDRNAGITRSPSYGIFGADLGLNVRAGEFVRFRGLFGMTVEQGRFLTDGRSGYSVLDSPGRRFYVKDAYGFHLLLDGAVLF